MSTDPLVIYDEMRAILKASGYFSSDSRIAQLVDEAQWNAGLLYQGAWGAAALCDGDRPAQAASMLRSVLPDDYKPVGA